MKNSKRARGQIEWCAQCAALLYAATFGGFVLGWIRDGWRIPDYVAEVNAQKPFRERHQVSYILYTVGCVWLVTYLTIFFTRWLCLAGYLSSYIL